MRVRSITISLLLVLPVVIYGCGGAAAGENPTRVLTAKEAKQLLLQLPFGYVFRSVSLPKGATGALAGKATSVHHVVLHFGVSLGTQPDGVPVPNSGVEEAYGYPRGGFVYTDDLMIPTKKHNWVANPRFHTWKQWHEAGHMEVEMEEKLCEATTGEPCPA